MEDLEKYLKILNSERCLRKPKEAAITLDLISECFNQEKSQFTIGLLISLVLDENDSILTFIWKTCTNNDTVSSVLAAFKLLDYLVTSFQKFSEPYFPFLFKKCLYLLDTKYAKIKEACLKLIRNMINVNSRHCINVSELVSKLEHFLNDGKKAPKSVSDQIFSLLGYLFQNFPESVRNEKWFFLKIFKSLQEESEAEKPSVGTVKGALEGINGYLVNYPVPDAETLKKIYQYIKYWTNLRKDRRAASQAGMHILQNHWKHFSRFMYDDKEYWRINVEVWIKQKGVDREPVFKFLCAFYSVVAFFIKQNSNTSELNSYVKEFTAALELKSNSYERKAALVGIRLFVLTDSLTGSKFNETYELLVKFIRNEETLNNFLYMPLCVECVSAFTLKFADENFFTEQLAFLQRLSVKLIENYPSLDSESQENAAIALEKSFYLLSLSSLDVMKNHIDKVLYQGLIRTCSVSTSGEVELLKETGQACNPVWYKSYLSLWKYLLTLTDSPNLPIAGSLTLKKGVAVNVFDAFVESFLKIISKLNFGIGLEMQVEKPSDLHILTNIVDLYQDVIPFTNFFNFQKWLGDIFRIVMQLSYKNPLVSGFYTIMSLNLKIADTIQFFENREEEKSFDMVEKFLEGILVKIDRFKGDLQVACFKVLLAAPVVLIKDFAEKAIPALEVIARFARSSFPLLNDLIEALERWDSYLPPATSGVIMEKILPCFDIFFQSPYFRGDDSVGYSKEGKKLKVEVVFNDSELLALQKKFLIFLGHMEVQRGISLIELPDAEERRKISDKQLIYSLPYNKGWVEMNLEEMIPRIVDLAESCGDRKTRLIACELLHSLVMIILGNINQLSGGYTYLFRKVMRSCLMLGCDADGLVCQIFEPLMFQIVHYFSGKGALLLMETNDLVDTLLEYVTCRYNPTVRDFSAVLLREFTVWTIRQTSPEQLKATPEGIKLILERIYSLALHPSYSKRLGAAVVFNKIYSVLREEEYILNAYWFQLYYCFLESLRMCEGSEDVTEIVDSIKHLERPLVEKHEEFNKDSPDRVVPQEFGGGRLCHLVKWTMELALDVTATTRHVAMDLFEKLAPLIKNCDSNIHFVSKRLQDFLQLQENSFHSSFCEEDFVRWLKNQTAGFEFCSWLLNQKVLTTEEIFQSSFKDILITFISSVMLHREKQSIELDKHKQESVLAVLSLLYALKERAYLFPEEHWELLQTAVFKPSGFGFDLYDASTIEQLLAVLSGLLRYLSTNLTTYDMEKFYENVGSIITPPSFSHVTQVRHISVEDLEFLFGLKVVEAAGIWRDFIRRIYFSLTEDHFIAPIFKSLFFTEGKIVYAVSLEPFCKFYLEEMLRILLQGSVNLDVLAFLENEEAVRDEETGKTVKKGEFFLFVFRNTIFNFLGSKHDLLVDWALKQKSIKALQLLVQVLESQSEGSQLPHQILLRLDDFENLKVREEELKNKVLLRMAVCGARVVGTPGFLKRSPVAEKIYATLENRKFYEMDHLEMESIFNLLPFFSDFEESLGDNNRLRDCLSRIQIESIVSKSEEVFKLPFTLKETVEALKFNRVHFIFGELLRSLKITGSLVIFDFILSRTPWVNAICKKEDLESCLSVFSEGRISADHALSALELAYDYCFNRKMICSPLAFYDLFLDPLTNILPVSIVYQLIDKNLESLTDLVSADWANEKSFNKISKLFLSKICAARLMQTLFKRTTKGELDEMSKERGQKIKGIVKKAFLLLKQPPPPDALIKCYRKMMCHVFNMICCIISSSCVDEKFYKLFIFDERGSFLFEVVDDDVTYNLGMDFNVIPKRKKHLTWLREEVVRQNRMAEPAKYIHTNTLFTSSLQEDVTRFDFTSSLIRATDSLSPHSKNAEIELEMDALNSHECMATIVATISKMVRDNIAVDKAAGLPCWLKFFFSVLTNSEYSKNLKLFIFKAIYNVQEFVAPYAKEIFAEFLQAVLALFVNLEINYFLFDLIEMMVGWRYLPEDERSQVALTTLVNFVLEKSDSCRRDIIAGNLEILKTIIEVWKDGLILPKLSSKVFRRFCLSVKEDLKSGGSADSASYLNIHACGILLSNGIPPWEEGSEQQFFYLLVKGFRDKNKQNQLFGEVCGLALNHIEKTKPETLEYYEQLVRSKINLQSGCWLHILHAVHKHHPKISSSLTFRILSSAWDSMDSLTVKKLEMLVGQTEEPEFERHGFAFITDMLNSADVAVQEITLEITGRIVHKLDVEKQKSVMKEVLRLQKSAYPGVRKQAYEVSKKLYQKGRNDVIGFLCRVMLLRGLRDGVKELEDSCLAFWRNIFTSSDFALLHIIKEMYTPETEDIFLSNTARMLLHLAGDDLNSQKTVFPHPITLQSKFRKRNLVLGTRRSFLMSLSSSGKTLANQSVENLATISRQNPPHLRPTPSSLTFQPTAVDKDEDADPVVDASWETPADGFVLPRNPYKRRFYKKEAKTYFSYSKKKQGSVEPMEKKTADVVIYGEYRDGDYPDIQVTHLQIVKLLEALATRDPQIARLFLVAFYSGLMKTVANEGKEAFLTKTSKCFENMLKSSENHHPGVFGFVLQVLLNHNKDLNFDCHLVANAAASSNWISLGALILEEVLNRKEGEGEEVAPKRRKVCGDSTEKVWWDLAKLYRGLEEFDVLSGIFLDKLSVSPDAKEAIRCETVANWQDALQHYVTILQSSAEDSQKEFYTESYLSCLAKLSKWSTMNKCIRETVNDNLDNLWENYYLLSWFVRSEMMISLGAEEKDFRAVFENFCKTPAKRNVLSTNFGQEMIVFDWFCENFQRANCRIDKLCLDFLVGWSHLDRWSCKLRAAKLASLQPLSELSFAAKNLAEVSRSELEQNVKLGEQRWGKNVPAPGDNLTIWDVKLGYRREFIKRLKDFDLAEVDVKSNLALARAALSENNLDMAKECLSRSQKKLPEGNFELEVEHQICFNLGKMIVAKTRLKEPDVGLRMYLKVWDEISQQISSTSENKSSAMLLYSCNFILGQLVSEVMPFVERQTASPQILELITARLDSDDFMPALKRKGLEHFAIASSILENLNSSPETKSNTYLEISKLLLKYPDPENFEKLCQNLLRSMALGNSEARELFGCLLNMSHLLPEGAPCEELIAQGEIVPSWMFLSWVNQMFACLNSRLYPFLRYALLRLAQDYPSAILYASKLLEEAKSEDPSTKSFFVELRRALPKDALFDNFCQSMKYLAPPHLVLKYGLEEALDEARQPQPDYLRINKIIFDLKQLMFSEDFKNFRGPVFEIYLKGFKDPLEDLLLSFDDYESLKIKLKTFLASIDGSKMPSRRTMALLKSYSPWLFNFHSLRVEGALELPGQYDGSRPPTAPVTIFSFKNEVLLFDSKCRPMRISILGNDAKEHKFLVKFGEDLRQDERIQRVFQHFNHRLTESRHTGRFCVDTYKVVPLTPSLGMIEWVEDTVSMFDMLENSLGNDSDGIAKAQSSHLSFFGRSSNLSGLGTVAAHLLAYETVEKHRAVIAFRTRVQEFPSDLLRRSFLNLSTSPQHFVHLRGNFATSHAIVCITHWLIGIGDRHLQNILISTKTGRVLGIDFGYAFGFATQFLTPPELLPFRLTPQILNLMRPLGECGWIKQTMIRCLRIFRKESFRLRSVLEVFAEEPVMDWLKQARKNPNRNAEGLEGWYPQEKVSLVESKLRGANPVAPFEADLRAGHAQSEHLEKFLQVLRGDPQDNFRARCGEGELTEEDQVECLIDLATDPHILSKTYVGWNPWL